MSVQQGRRGGGAQQGAALVLVLWLVLLLSGVVAAFAFTARVEQLQARSGEDLLRGGEIARAGLEYALSRLQGGSSDQPRWVADGRLYEWQFAGQPVQLRLQSEAGKVDLNHAQAPLLAALLVQAGADPVRAARLAAAIVDWRDADDLVQPGGGAEKGQYLAAGLAHGPANAPFSGIGELRRVLGMDEALFQALQPWITVWSDRLQPEPALAPEPVLRAMGLDPAPWLQQRQLGAQGNGTSQVAALASSGDTFSIDVRTPLGDDRQAWLRAVVRSGAVEAVGPAYTALQWQQGMETR